MSKKIEKFVTRVGLLTQKQKDAMPTYRDKWIEIGLKTGETDWETFDKYMPICYEKANIKYPARIVRVQSPLVGALASAVAEAIWKKRRGAVSGAVSGAVEGAVGEAVDEAVDEAVGGAVREAVSGAVRGVVSGAVDEAVRGVVSGAVDEAVDEAVGGAVEGAVDVAIKVAKENNVTFSWHNWLGGQFWVGWGWYYGVSFVNFFFDICNLKLAQDIMERAEAYRKVSESVNYIWPNTDFIMVCARPSFIHRNKNGRLHNEHGMSIRYSDGYGLYHLNGVKFDEVLYKKIISREMPIEECLKITDIDQRIQATKFAKNGLREFYKQEGGKKVDEIDKLDTKMRTVHYELWKLPPGKIFNQEVAFAIYDCPSSIERGERQEYSKGVPVNFNDVASALAWGMSSDDFPMNRHEFLTLIPLEDEA